jgi:hypothetical protein
MLHSMRQYAVISIANKHLGQDAMAHPAVEKDLWWQADDVEGDPECGRCEEGCRIRRRRYRGLKPCGQTG